MISLFLMIVPFGIALVVLSIPGIIDLVRRDERVAPWWGLPLVLFAVPAFGAAVVPATMDPGMEQVGVMSGMWAMVHVGMAGMLLVLALMLALSRGLRPGGDTLRRRRTSVVAIAALLGVMVLPWLPGLIAMMWVVPAAWVGLVWVVALNRTGPARLENGKRMSASLLLAAALAFFIGGAHIVHLMTTSSEPLEVHPGVWIFAAIVMGALAAGLRQLSGPVHPAPLVAVAATAVTLIFPAAWSWSWDPLPPESKPAVWEDFRGATGPSLDPLHSAACIRWVRGSGIEEVGTDRCYGNWGPILVDRDVRLSEMDLNLDGSFLVGNGRQGTHTWGRHGNTMHIHEVDGHAVLTTDPMATERLSGEKHYTLGPDLTQAIYDLGVETDGALIVHASDRWTFQDFIRMCASLDRRPYCMIR